MFEYVGVRVDLYVWICGCEGGYMFAHVGLRVRIDLYMWV